MSEVPIESLAGFRDSRAIFDSAYNELMRCKLIMDGRGKNALDACDAIQHFVQVLGGNRDLRDYLLDLLNKEKSEV